MWFGRMVEAMPVMSFLPDLPAGPPDEDDGPEPCRECDGDGVVEVGDGPNAIEVPCPACQMTERDRWEAHCDGLYDQRKDDELTGDK